MDDIFDRIIIHDLETSIFTEEEKEDYFEPSMSYLEIPGAELIVTGDEYIYHDEGQRYITPRVKNRYADCFKVTSNGNRTNHQDH